MHPYPVKGSGPNDFYIPEEPAVEFFPERICSKHKRCTPGSANCAEPPCDDRHYLIDGEREVNGLPIVSVTTVTKEIGDTFGQGAWWGMTVGLSAYPKLDRLEWQADPDHQGLPNDPSMLASLATKHKLTVNHVRDDAAKRGTDVHALAEDWAKTKKVPEGDGHAAALRNFIETEKVQPMEAEVLVGSRKYGYAGQADLIARFPKLDAIGLCDFKTKSKPKKGKPVAYEQHHLQIRGYEDARIEMGQEPTDFQCVVNLYPDGEYAIVQGRATSEQWQAALGAYRSLTALRSAIKQAA